MTNSKHNQNDFKQFSFVSKQRSLQKGEWLIPINHSIQLLLNKRKLSSCHKTTNSETKSGGVKTPAMQQEYSKAPSTQVEHDDVVQVSSVDVLSFGGLDYDDRELKQQNRLVELRIRINEKGSPSTFNYVKVRVFKALMNGSYKLHVNQI